MFALCARRDPYQTAPRDPTWVFSADLPVTPRSCFPGEPRLVHARAHQGEPSERHAFLFRPGPAADIRPDGEGLVPTLPALRTLPGLSEPKESQRNVDGVLVVRGTRRAGTLDTNLTSIVDTFVLICHPVLR